MMLQTIVKPVILRLESDQDAGRPSVPRDEDLLGLRQAQEVREVVLDLSQRRLAHPASRDPQANAPLQLS